MIRHFFTIILRNIKRDLSTFLINLIGLTAGLTCTILIYLWVNDELTMNHFNPDDEWIYQVMENQHYSDRVSTTTSTPGLLAQSLKEEIPEVKLAATVMWVNDYDLTVGEKSLPAKGLRVGKDYFSIFHFPLLIGNAKQALADKSSIVISEELALSLFGDLEKAMGQSIMILQANEILQVTGIFQKQDRSALSFEFAFSYEAQQERQEWLRSWESNGPSTFIKLQEGADAASLSEKIKDYIKKKDKESHIELFLQRFSDRYLYSKFNEGKLVGGRIDYVKLFSTVAVVILLIACLNFMNLSTAQATRKAKEVGVKKSVGADRSSLMLQFLSETAAVTFMALCLSLLLVLLLLPLFNFATGKSISFQWANPVILLGIVLIALISALLAGSYPAFFLSAFKPVDVLKGNWSRAGGEIWVRKGLVIVQFATSVILIAAVWVIYQQIEFTQSKSLGFDKENLIVIPAEGKVRENINTFIQEVKNIPGVQAASSLGHNVAGRNNNTRDVYWPGKHPDDWILFETMWVNYETHTAMGFEMLEGRFFSPQHGQDSTKVIVNEAAVRAMNIPNPIGATLRINDSGPLEIIGIVKDFHFQSLHSVVEPLYMLLNDRNTWNVVIRIQRGEEKNVLEKLSAFYTKYNAGFPLEYSFLETRVAELYLSEQRMATLANYFALFALLISCLGLYGLASYTTERRLKEMGIRKAMGSSSFNILLLLSTNFTKLVMIGIIIGLPLSYWWLTNWLNQFAFHIELSIWHFAGTALLAVFIAWSTILSKAWKASRVNPVDCIRIER